MQKYTKMPRYNLRLRTRYVRTCKYNSMHYNSVSQTFLLAGLFQIRKIIADPLLKKMKINYVI